MSFRTDPEDDDVVDVTSFLALDVTDPEDDDVVDVTSFLALDVVEQKNK